MGPGERAARQCAAPPPSGAIASERQAGARRGPRAAWSLLAAGALAAVAHAAPPPPAGDLDDPVESGTVLLRVFRDSDGLPQNTVHAITLDGRGYLWAGTQDGAASYDGRGWKVVNLPDRTHSNFVRCIEPGQRGDLWFGTLGGLLRLTEGVWRPVPGLPMALVHQRINALLETRTDGESVLWVGTHGQGLWRLEGTAWRQFTTADGLPDERVWALLETHELEREPRLWVGTEAGIGYLPGEGDRLTVEAGSPTASVNSLVETVGPDGASNLWAGSYGAGVACRTRGEWRRFTTADGLPSDFVTSLVDAAPGAATPAVWVGTDGGGLARLEGGRARPLIADPPLPSNAVYSLARTSAAAGTEALWVGTRNGGLARLREGQWRSFRPLTSAPWMSVNAVLPIHDDAGAPAIWFGLDGGGLARLQRGRWTFVTASAGGFASNNVQCLLETVESDGSSAVWVGTRNGGLARFARGRWTAFTVESGALPSNLVQSLVATRDAAGVQTLWVGTRGGLSLLRGGRWSSVPADALPNPSVVALAAGEPGEGAVWVGTAGGLARFDGRTWRSYGADLGLLNDTVQALHPSRSSDGRRVLWIGTDGGGASCMDVESGALLFTLTDSSQPALPNNVVYQILEDDGGRLYLPTNKGVARLVARPGEVWERGAFDVFTFTWEDGLPRSQCNRGAGAIDAEGRIWVGTVGGAAVLDSVRDWVDRAPKRLALDGWVAGDRARPLRSGVALEYTDRHLVFEYVLLSFFREAETEYRTQLVGLERVASEWGKDVRREYRALPPGAYTFRVWGRDYAGNVAGPQELAIGIKPAPWQTWWAYLLALLLCTGLIALMVHARLLSHERREAELQKLVDARTRELSEANQLLMEFSYLDPVTGIANRRRFEERVRIEAKRAIRGRSPLSLLMIDIDLFKDYNDTYGHQRGDACLKAVAGAFADGLPRSGDSVARFGGEEFAVILPLTGRPGAMRVAEQLRHRVEELGLPHRSSTVAKVVTISCGVATLVPEREDDIEALVRLADEALYRAKQAGRNRTEAAD